MADCGERRLPEDRGDENRSSEVLCVKKKKRLQCGDDVVIESHAEFGTKAGFSCIRAFHRTGSRQTYEDVLHSVENSKQLQSNNRMFSFHTAFKEALKTQLSDIKAGIEDPDSCRLILIHGVPQIGKSALASCLAYYLALVHDKVTYIKLHHTKDSDSHALTDALCDYFQEDVLIMDQCNVNALDRGIFFEQLRCRKDNSSKNVPIVMFTSGHYTPNNHWMTLMKDCSFKIISMRMDAPAVQALKDSYQVPLSNKVLSNEKLLEVTNIYGRMLSCVMFLASNTNEIDKDELEDFIYETVHISILKQEALYHFVWIAWKDYVDEFPEEEDLKPQDFALKPELVQYFGYLTSRTKDPADQGMNRILNWLDITGEKVREENGYHEYKPESYIYFFPCQRPIYGFLTELIADRYDQKSAYKAFLESYKLLRKNSEPCTAFIEGGLYEQLIKLYFKMYSAVEKYGLSVDVDVGNTLSVTAVDSHCTAFTVAQLCNLVAEPPGGLSRKAGFWKCWVVLNAGKGTQFKGYDFAYFVVVINEKRPVKVKELQLFQATVNPLGKSNSTKALMLETLLEIETELVAKKLVTRDKRVVMPYFLCPDMCKPIQLKSKTNTLTAHVIKFAEFERLNVAC